MKQPYRLVRFEDAPKWAQAVLAVLGWIGTLPYLAQRWGREKARDAGFALRNEHRARYYSPWVVFWFRLYWRLWYRLGGV